MAKQTKNTLTYAECKKDVLDKLIKPLPLEFLSAFLVILFCGISIGLSTFLFETRFIILGIIPIVLFSAVIISVICTLVFDIKEIIDVKSDKVLISKDSVISLEKGVHTRNPGKLFRILVTFGRPSSIHRFVNVIHFSQYGSYETREVYTASAYSGFDVFDMTTPGEELYIVYLPRKKNNKIYFVYHTNMYEYKER